MSPENVKKEVAPSTASTIAVREQSVVVNASAGGLAVRHHTIIPNAVNLAIGELIPHRHSHVFDIDFARAKQVDIQGQRR